MSLLDTQISVIGLGKLGSAMAAAIASKGFSVRGVDVNPETVSTINNGKAPVQEPMLQDLISSVPDRLSATVDFTSAIRSSNISFVVVPTPSDRNGAFSIGYAVKAFREIGYALREKNTYHLVVLTSTVLPGALRFGLLPVLEEASGKVCGKDIGLCYSPEFIALGSVIHDFLNPDFLLIGEFDEQSGDLLENVYGSIMENSPPCKRMSIENAELTKIALNCYVTMKITFANALVDICEKIPGGNIDDVTGALGLDSRIGKRYLTGGLGYGGPCFPRDNIAFGYLARTLGSSSIIADLTDQYNRSIPRQFLDRFLPFLNKKSKIAILGLAYKPSSPVIEESQGMILANELTTRGYQVCGYDPLADPKEIWAVNTGITLKDSVRETIRDADVVLITIPDPKYRHMKAEDFSNHLKPVTVVDFWRILDDELRNHEKIRYIPIGHSNHDGDNAARLKQLWQEC
jgi:UDPglucose 6-dehydrogenase